MISRDSSNEYQKMQIISSSFKSKKDNNTYTYIITYSAKPDRYSQYNSTVTNIIDSLKIIDYLPIPKDFDIYNPTNSSFNLQYPLDWLPPISYGNYYTEFKPNISKIKEVYYKNFNNHEENESIDYPEPDPIVSILSIPFEKRSLFSFIQDDLGIKALGSNFELVESKDTSKEAIPSYQIKYFSDDKMILGKYILNKENSNIYIISYEYTWPEFYNFLPIMEEIISSFDFTSVSKTIKNKFNGFKVGEQPFGLAVNSLTNILYVANSVSNTISVINGSNDKIIENIDVSNNPLHVAVNQIHNLVYVTHPNSLSIIDAKNNTLIDKISISVKEPMSLSVNEVAGRIYIADGISKNVSVIDSNNNKEVYVIATIDKPFDKTKYIGSGVTLDPFKNRIYIVNDVNSSIFVINGEDNRIIEVIPINEYEHPYDIIINPLTDKAYIVGHKIINNEDIGSFVSEVSLSDHKEKFLGYGEYTSQFNFITLHQLTNTIYLTDPTSNQIRYIDLSNDENDIIPINVDISQSLQQSTKTQIQFI